MPAEPVLEAGELEAQAVAWLVRGEAGDCSVKERALLQAWLAIPRHRAVYIRMRTAWLQADRLRCLQPLDGHVNPDLLEKAVLPGLRGATAPRPQSPFHARAPVLGYILVAVVFTALVSGITAWLVVEHTL